MQDVHNRLYWRISFTIIQGNQIPWQVFWYSLISIQEHSHNNVLLMPSPKHPRTLKNILTTMCSRCQVPGWECVYLGKYIDGSGAEIILAESKAFEKDVVRSVLDGTHYTRSLKGLMLLSECFETLQWAEFFRIKGIREYMNELSLIQLMKSSAAEKIREQSRAHLEAFMSTSSRLIDDFNAFRSERCEVSETFAFWDRFVKMVSILRDLVRADCEGTWDLHLQSIQAVLPLFASYDRINYLRWGSVSLEDIRKLPQDAPSVFENFKAGKFVVKRTEGQFTAVGADMCLEQTINRSQKSAGGIIGSTKRKQSVTQWEMIHHEMLATVNLQCMVRVLSHPVRNFWSIMSLIYQKLEVLKLWSRIW